ncbi:hypothetical protein DFH09DRAFT_1381071 [Mycena vulgaris]|nr:hypothetical protein DFH09DRAFT_1381071 [Mycena vulgaris]
MLPDEIISEILSHALKVSDELFSDASDVSPFAAGSPSTSAYLLVCKDWLRVATPLLYNVVVLRSKAQAYALEKVLRSNPELGGFVRMLRVEGGYGMAMHTILKSAPNITDLSLCLTIWSPDSTDGLCKGLPLINPHRVIIVDPVVKKLPKNQQQAALIETLFLCIRKWDNLKIFGYPYPAAVQGIQGWSQRAANLMDALAESKTIHTILLSKLLGFHQFFRPLLKIPALQVLQFQTPYVKRLHEYAIEAINSDPEVKALARYNMPAEDDSTNTVLIPDIIPSLDPNFVPMESAPQETREVVWKVVFSFTASMDPPPPHHYAPPSINKDILAISRVCKAFNRLALPYCYHRLCIKTHSVAPIAQQLRNHPDLGSSISSIELYNMTDPPIDFILSQANRLERFISRPITRKDFVMLAETAGSTLRELTNSFTSVSRLSASVFVHFTELRVYEVWAMAVLISPAIPPAANLLDKLHTLSIHGCNQTFLEFCTALELKSLHTFKIDDTYDQTAAVNLFLVAHGSRLRHITLDNSDGLVRLFDTCGSLVDAEFPMAFNLANLTCKTPHESLTKINTITVHGNPEDINSEMFPALREIQCCAFRWSTTEREIARNRWVPVAEALLQKNIKLTDSAGTDWIPRVKSGRARGGKSKR